MGDYIKREDARKAACELCDWYGFCGDGCIGHPIDDVPAADVVERKRGEWVWPDKPRDRPYCSECLNDAFWDDDHGFVTENFCPICGADMRKPQREVDDEKA